MRRCRLAALSAGAGLLIGAVPAVAAADRGRGAPADEAEALALLQQAVVAGRELTWNGTQRVARWGGKAAGSHVAQVSHDPAAGATVQADLPMAVTAVLDPRAVELLADAYELAVVGPGRCTGRTARVVEATRRDGSVAGRFWVDRTSGLLLRREVFDTGGRRLTSSAFVELELAADAAAPAARVVAADLPGRTRLQDLRDDGWRVPSRLPGGFRLIDTDLSTPRPGRPVLHLAYSDGLSSLSLFAQPGRLGTAPLDGFREQEVGGRPVWVREASPERVVWSGGGRVWTLVSDAPDGAVRDVVADLPRDAAPRDGLGARLARGLGRLGGLLNPFD